MKEGKKTTAKRKVSSSQASKRVVPKNQTPKMPAHREEPPKVKKIDIEEINKDFDDVETEDRRLIVFISTLSILTLLALYWPLSWKNISFKSQVNKLEDILSKADIILPLWEQSLKDLDEDSAYTVISIIDELTEKYNKDQIVNKIISYNYDNEYRYSTHSEIRDYLGLNIDEKDSYYNSNTYFNYRQDTDESNGIDVAWYSKLYRFQEYNEDRQNNILTIKVNNEEYKIDLSEHIQELIEKSELYRKSDPTNEDEEELKKPALILDWENYRLIVTWFHWEKNRITQKTQLNNIEWYILIK